ncbi:MAG: AraC family transcriptional regulator [Saccharofermentanales bacterium]
MNLATLDFQFIFIHNPKTEVLTHSHDSYELVYYFEGEGVSSTDKQQFAYGPNTYSIYAPNLPHNEYHKCRTSVYCIGFMLQPVCNITIETGNFCDKDLSILQLTEKIKQEAFQHEPHYKEVINILLSEFLYRFDRQNNQDSAMHDDLYKIKKYINENIGTDINMNDLSELSGYSYHYFRHLFKEQTGLSPKQYIINQRLEYSKILLANSPSSVLDIALTCGFACSSQFDTIFRRYAGKSPVQYRKEVKSAKS